MQKFMLSVISAFVLSFCCSERPVEKGPKLQWMSLQEAETAMQKEKRPILIDLYTDWCGWCKVMDKKTYSNANVITYLQNKFYPVRLDAETRATLHWGNKDYGYNAGSRTNDLAIYLTYGRLSYPTTVIIPTDNSGPQPVPGYHEPKEFELIVRYFGDGKFGKQPFEEYQKGFKASW
jgi:thioredoxin-related protein